MPPEKGMVIIKLKENPIFKKVLESFRLTKQRRNEYLSKKEQLEKKNQQDKDVLLLQKIPDFDLSKQLYRCGQLLHLECVYNCHLLELQIVYQDIFTRKEYKKHIKNISAILNKKRVQDSIMNKSSYWENNLNIKNNKEQEITKSFNFIASEYVNYSLYRGNRSHNIPIIGRPGKGTAYHFIKPSIINFYCFFTYQKLIILYHLKLFFFNKH